MSSSISLTDDGHWDFPTRGGGGRPGRYARCADCERTVPAINGRLSGHYAGCDWAFARRKEVERILSGEGAEVTSDDQHLEVPE